MGESSARLGIVNVQPLNVGSNDIWAIGNNAVGENEMKGWTGTFYGNWRNGEMKDSGGHVPVPRPSTASEVAVDVPR